MLEQLHWPTLQHRREEKRLIAFHKAVNNLAPITIPDYVQHPAYSGTRSHSQAYIEIRANYEQYKNSFIARTIRDWNALPPGLVLITSADDFRDSLQKTTV